MAIQTNSLNSELLNAAILGLESQKRKIEEQLDQVRALLGIRPDGQKRRGRPPKTAADAIGSDVSLVAAGPQKRRRFSAETRARMAAAQQKRWAIAKGQSSAPEKAAPKKRKLSAAGRKRIIEATKKRWAEYKAKKAAS
jgi:hypothetical protein